MRHARLLLVLVLLTACGRQQTEAPHARAEPTPELANGPACMDFDGPLRVAYETRRSPGPPAPDITRPGADPVKDAERAAASGDFRLMWTGGMGFSYPVGVSCRIPSTLPGTSRTPLTLLSRTASDVPLPCDYSPETQDSCRFARAFAGYAPVYNQTLIAHARFPYADLCRPSPQGDRWKMPNLGAPRTMAAAQVVETDAPRTLGEAARRGSDQALAAWISRAGPARINDADHLGLTPLAWAVIENRPGAVARLLRAGADPLSQCARLQDRAEAVPLRLALELGYGGMAEAMLTKDVVERLTPWPSELIEAAVRGDQAALVRRMLTEPHESVMTGNLISYAKRSASQATVEAITSISPDGLEATLEYAVVAGDLAMLKQALAARPDLNTNRNQRRHLLGLAVQSKTPRVDKVVALLLANGADPNGPGAWNFAYPQGSEPATALAALVAHANRTFPGSSPDPAWRATGEAQRRALELLLKAGARTETADEHGRPLVIIAVMGKSEFGAYGAELPPGWLTRLAKAGMDVNAGYQAATALDWLAKGGTGRGAMAKELRALGGRSVGPPVLSRGPAED